MEASLLDTIKDKLLALDPVYWVEKHLTLDGKPFRIHGNGYKPYAEIYRCIGVKALEKDSLPIAVCKSRQTGMTTCASAMEMYFLGSGIFGFNGRPPIRIIHAFPFLDLAFSYSKTKFAAMISGSSVPDEQPIKGKQKSCMQLLLDEEGSESQQFKQFKGNNHIWIESVGIDATRLRGKTVDIIFFDEVQQMSSTAMSNALKTMMQAQYGNGGVQVMFGTPLQRGSMFYDIWNNSTQQYYYLGCEKCKKHFPLYTPNSNDWEDIWLYGFIVRCTHCGFEQDKRDAAERGKWISTKDKSDAKFMGFHINQLYMPHITKEKLLSEKPGISAINTERAYQNEVLGEFYHGESAIITPDQIRELCGDPERKFRASISPAEDLLVFLGIDIGEKADIENLVDSDKVRNKGQSYSTAVVIAMTGPQRMSIEFATKFKRNDLTSKKGIIDEIMRKYSVNLGVIDLGYTRDLSEILQTEYGMKMLSSNALPRVNDKIKFADQVFPKTIMFEKDFWIADMFEQMKKGNVRFPLGSFEQISWLLQHCVNFEIKPSISRTGDVQPHYVKSGHTDGFSALLNAYIAMKFYVSNGFKIKHPSLMKTEKKEGIPAILGYCPKLR
jgi:hypothetical protein